MASMMTADNSGGGEREGERWSEEEVVCREGECMCGNDGNGVFVMEEDEEGRCEKTWVRGGSKENNAHGRKSGSDSMRAKREKGKGKAVCEEEKEEEEEEWSVDDDEEEDEEEYGEENAGVVERQGEEERDKVHKVTALFNQVMRIQRHPSTGDDDEEEEDNGSDGSGDGCLRVNDNTRGFDERTATEAANGDAEKTMAAPECSICFDMLGAHNIALVSGCMHAYCIDCIIRWSRLSSRTQAEQQQRALGSRGGIGAAGLRRNGSTSRHTVGGANIHSSVSGDDIRVACPTCKGPIHSLLTYRRCHDDSVHEELHEETLHWWMMMAQTSNTSGAAHCSNNGCGYDETQDEDDLDYDYGCYDDEYGVFHDVGMVKSSQIMMAVASKKKKKKNKSNGAAAGGSSGASGSGLGGGGASRIIANRPFGKNGYIHGQGRQFARPRPITPSTPGASTSSSMEYNTPSRGSPVETSLRGDGAGACDDNDNKGNAASASSALLGETPPSKQSGFVSPAAMKRLAKKEKKELKEKQKREKRMAKLSSSPATAASVAAATPSAPPAPPPRVQVDIC